MATLAIGDVHGHFDALEDLLRRLETRSGDTVVFLGDYIDRGLRTRECVDAILELPDRRDVQLVCLRGNHEDWMLRTLADATRHSWLLGMGAFETIASYSPDAAQVIREAASAAGAELVLGRCALPYHVFFDAMPKAHLEFFSTLRPFHRDRHGIYVHAGLDPAIDRIEEQTVETLLWGNPAFPASYLGTHEVVYGHWGDPEVSRTGWPRPRMRGRTIGIDTIAHGVLTAVRLPGRRVFQSGRHSPLEH